MDLNVLFYADYNLTLCLGRKTTTAKPNLQPDTPYTLRQCCTADTHDLCQSSDAMRRDCGGTCYVDEVRQQENQNRSCAVLCNSTLLRRVIECEDKCPGMSNAHQSVKKVLYRITLSLLELIKA